MLSGDQLRQLCSARLTKCMQLVGCFQRKLMVSSHRKL
ncbi:Uncharacterised protein [Kluyvera cryocrescens]|uniref:Uncharacterized protein n=1 Tax=Kluyvera cryocrescens TaxID=580 RepID=A0A485B581_KLUCR|nr:Uncharacterised protein [Kluyvera cryocrescens]